ncbi:MAG: beta-carotene 15,15'-dioxygenase, Brp/Blh family [Planctomycetota bacterium]
MPVVLAQLALLPGHASGAGRPLAWPRGAAYAVAVLAAVVLGVAGVGVSGALAGSWVWVMALVVAGMPHGAYDLAEMQRRWGLRGAMRSFVPYAAAFVSCGLAFVVAPVVVLLAFLVLTMVHFGLSDTRHLRIRASGLDGGLLGRALAFAHGGVVIAAVFAFQPGVSWRPFAEIAGLVGGAAGPMGVPIAALQAAAVLVMAVGGLVVAASAVIAWRHDTRMAAAEIIGVPLLAVASASALPPLLAVGMYFVCVHATRHCVRVGDRGDGALRAFARTHALSVPLLVPSLAIVGLLALPFAELGWVPAFALAFLLFCVVATLPHHALWFGRACGGWCSKRSAGGLA